MPNKKPLTTIVIPLYAKIFEWLNAITLTAIVRKTTKNKILGNGVQIEAWVIFNTYFALVSACLVNAYAGSYFATFLIFYGIWRTFEIVVVQMNILFFDEWRAKEKGNQYKLIGYRRLVLLLLHNFCELIFWFTAVIFYMKSLGQIHLNQTGFFETMLATFTSMVGFSISASIKPLTSLASSVLIMQTAIGVFITILTLSRFVSLIPKPDTEDNNEK